MKKIFSILFLLSTIYTFGQKPCEIDTDVKDSLGTYKATKSYQIFERSFAGNSTRIFFSLASDNGIIVLDFQFIQQSEEFIKAFCLDKNSKLYLQLNNGKIATLLHAGKDTCGTLVRNEKGNVRLTHGTFVFAKENYEDLKTSKVTFMRILTNGETTDYPFKTEFVSELDNNRYEPENYFIDYLKCIEN